MLTMAIPRDVPTSNIGPVFKISVVSGKKKSKHVFFFFFGRKNNNHSQGLNNIEFFK
jgi:hypothetical protein